MRSPGCISSSTYFFSARLTKGKLSDESPRSSTASTMVRRVCSGRRRTRAAGATAAAAGLFESAGAAEATFDGGPRGAGAVEM
jgi:hypothetical protein